MDSEVEVTPMQKICSDLLIGAIEGGINYWAYVTRYKNQPEHDTQATIVPQDNQSEQFTVNWLKMKNGIDLIAEIPADKTKANKDISMQCRVIVACQGEKPYIESVDWDADTADCILQVALFGEVVYG